MSEQTLLPCPFCGGEPRISRRQDEDIWTHNTVTWIGVQCGNCDVGFDWPEGAEPDSVECWNTRVTYDENATTESTS